MNRKYAAALVLLLAMAAGFQPGGFETLSRARNWAFDFGARGDGSTDDTARLSAMILGLENYDTLVLRKPASGGYYKLTDAITISKPLKIVGDGNMPEIRQTVANKGAFIVTSDNVTFEGIKITGPQAATEHTAGESAIYAYGASAASPLRNLRVLNCECGTWGGMAIDAKWVTGFEVRGNTFDTLQYAGFHGQSVLDGVIIANRIRNITGDPLAYGITLSRAEVDSLVTDPRSARVTVTGNEINGVPKWVGIDTHGGEHLTIAGNLVYGCHMGIGLIRADGAGQVNMYAPRYIAVSGNVIDSLVDDGSAHAGIVIAGAGASGSVTEYAEGIAITGNTVRRHGMEDNNTSGGILAQDTKGLAVTGNNLHSCSPFGVNVYFENKHCNVQGNTVLDAWSSTYGYPGAIVVAAENNSGYIGENTMGRGSKTITSEEHSTVNTQLRGNASSNEIVTGRSSNTFGTSYASTDNYAVLDLNGGNVVSGWINAASDTWDPGSTLSQNNAAKQVTCLGARMGDKVTVGFSSTIPTGVMFVGNVTAGGTVTVLMRNTTASTQDLDSGTIKVEVVR